MQLLHCCDATKTLLHPPSQSYVSVRLGWGILPSYQKVNDHVMSHIVQVYRQWRRYNTTVRELSRLNDSELSDIGITRTDIPRAAWESSEH